MNIFIPLILGFALGYFIRKKTVNKKEEIRRKIEVLVSITMAVLIFFMGMKIARVRIDASFVLLSSLILSFLAIIMPLLLAIPLRRWLA